MPYCSGCGEELSGGESFCPECGDNLKESSGDSGVVVNVQQSADHASSSAESNGEGDATESAETASTDENAQQEAGHSQEDEHTKEDYLLSYLMISSFIGLIGGFLSFVIGASQGMGWVELLTTFPYGVPLWILISAPVVFVAALVDGYRKAPSAREAE